jgi:adenine phosphoribosyltransferase
MTEKLKSFIRDIPDFPEKGIIFRDITTLLADPGGMALAISSLKSMISDETVEGIAGIDARGFIFGSILAHELHLPFIPIRKKGKLPFQTISKSYDLEYGQDEIEVHIDAVTKNQKILIVDDLIATGGTAIGAIDLLTSLSANVIGCAFIVGLPDLGGIKKIRDSGIRVEIACSYSGH